MKKLIHALVWNVACPLFACVLATPAVCAPDVSAQTDPLQRPALMAARASGAVMLAICSAGARTVAAGERGIVLWSDDGKTWHQAKVPVSVTLTALSFPSAQQGWAVGHGGVILHSTDRGESWTRQLDGRAAAQIEQAAARASGDAKRIARAEQLVGDGPDKPFLAVHFFDERRGFVVGAYGLIFGTEDGGATWTSWFDRVPNSKGLHLNALHVAGDIIFLAGEQGMILRSTDGARSFQPLELPYKGSWFALAGSGRNVVVAGLRGNVFRSTDAGATWSPAQVPVPVTINSALATKNGDILFANQAGTLMSSSDAGERLKPVNRVPGSPLTALAERPDGALFAASMSGPLQLAPPGESRNP